METQIHIELATSHCYILMAHVAKECYESPTHSQQMLIRYIIKQHLAIITGYLAHQATNLLFVYVCYEVEPIW
jgi:hypothetical protein